MADEVIRCISANLTPYVASSPGIGKSSVIQQVSKQGRLKLIDFRLSQCTPEDLQGFPMRTGNKASFVPFDLFPIEGEEPPEGYDGWLLFLDEMSSASKSVQAAAYKLILDRQVGSFNLHTNCAIVAAGNKITDKAVVTQMSTALQSRIIHYELEASIKEWTEWAVGSGIDHRVIGFLNYMPNKLMDFRPDHSDKTFPCPRTWEFVSRLIEGEEVTETAGPRLAGTVGAGAAVEFITFAQEYNRLPKLSDIVDDPENVDVPREASTKYATISMLMENHTEDNMEHLIKYIARFDIEMQIVFCRGVNVRSPKLRANHQAFGTYIMSMLRFLK